MANQTITQLPAAQALTGTELVPIVQDGGTVKTTVADIANAPTLTFSFLTATSEAGLPDSRLLATSGNGLTLTDNGGGSTLNIALSGAPASLISSGNGIQVKTNSTTLAARSVAVGAAGLSVADGDGVAGNPTISLTGMPLYLAQSTGVGLLTRTSGNSVGVVTLLGTTNQITLSNGSGDGADPTVALALNAVLPGQAGIVLPKGLTSDRPGLPTEGTLRYNTQTATFEGYTSFGWGVIQAGSGVTSFSGGGTGLTPSSPTAGAISLNGTLIGANGGTGVVNTGKTITLGGSLTLSGAYDLTLTQTGATNVTLPTTGTLATLAGSETLTNKTINGPDNTLTNISNSSLSNSSITINGSWVSLGGSVTVTATASNALTIGTGLSGTSYNGSTAVTIAISNTGVSAASYGTASAVPTIAVNAQGQITSAVDTAIAIAASQVTSGTLAIARGGTNGSATPTAGAVPYGNGTAYAFSAAGNASEVLLSGGAGSPTWAAQSTLSVGTATNAVNIGITDDTSTNATMYPVWVTANTGNLPAKVTSTKLSFNPSTGILTATGGVAGGAF